MSRTTSPRDRSDFGNNDISICSCCIAGCSDCPRSTLLQDSPVCFLHLDHVVCLIANVGGYLRLFIFCVNMCGACPVDSLVIYIDLINSYMSVFVTFIFNINSDCFVGSSRNILRRQSTSLMPQQTTFIAISVKNSVQLQNTRLIME